MDSGLGLALLGSPFPRHDRWRYFHLDPDFSYIGNFLATLACQLPHMSERLVCILQGGYAYHKQVLHFAGLFRSLSPTCMIARAKNQMISELHNETTRETSARLNRNVLSSLSLTYTYYNTLKNGHDSTIFLHITISPNLQSLQSF